MKVSGFCELTLQTENPAQLASFYVDCFGLRELSRDPEGVWLAVGETARLGLWRPGTKQFGDRGGAHVHFALSVAPGELERIAQRLRSCGLPVQGPVEHDGGDRSVYLNDPEGNVVEAWDHFGRDRTVEEFEEKEPA
jgi:catechol-2,3-dioxygenase